MKRRVHATLTFDVEIDESKFTPEFFQQFNDTIADFDDSLDEHIEHLASQFALGRIHSGSFIEGYGPAVDMGIRFSDPTGHADESEIDVELGDLDPEPRRGNAQAHAAWRERHPDKTIAAGE